MGLPSTSMTAAEYLAWEREQVERHEYCRGEVFAMAGGSPRHNALSAAILRDLGVAVRGTGCRALSPDQRIAIRPAEHYVYADASLVCGPLELAPETSDVLANPCAIFEILSRSTEAYDRGDKWGAYRRIASLREYFLVSQTVQRIEVYRREDARWHYEVIEAGKFEVSGFELDIERLYEEIMDLPGD